MESNPYYGSGPQPSGLGHSIGRQLTRFSRYLDQSLGKMIGVTSSTSKQSSNQAIRTKRQIDPIIKGLTDLAATVGTYASIPALFGSKGARDVAIEADKLAVRGMDYAADSADLESRLSRSTPTESDVRARLEQAEIDRIAEQTDFALKTNQPQVKKKGKKKKQTFTTADGRRVKTTNKRR